jgi:hypothetical protein
MVLMQLHSRSAVAFGNRRVSRRSGQAASAHTLKTVQTTRTDFFVALQNSAMAGDFSFLSENIRWPLNRNPKKPSVQFCVGVAETSQSAENQLRSRGQLRVGSTWVAERWLCWLQRSQEVRGGSDEVVQENATTAASKNECCRITTASVHVILLCGCFLTRFLNVEQTN